MVKLPELITAPRLMPNCLRIVRCTSATVTLSITCSSPSTVEQVDDELFGGFRCRRRGLLCVSVRRQWSRRPQRDLTQRWSMAPPVAWAPRLCWRRRTGRRCARRAWRRAACARCRSARRRCRPSRGDVGAGHEAPETSSRPLRSAPTAISSVRICWPLVSKKKALVWPSRLAIRNTRFDACTTASTLSGSETSTSLSSNGNCTRIELPTPRRTRLATGSSHWGNGSTECGDLRSDLPFTSAACAARYRGDEATRRPSSRKP